jgi:preprotein translocase subunit SecD
VRKNSGFMVTLVILALGLLVYFVNQPLFRNINLGLDLRGGLRVVLQARKERGTGHSRYYTESGGDLKGPGR